MTIKEAKQQIIKLQDQIDRNWSGDIELDADEHYEALDIAIEALEKQILEELDIGMFCPNCMRGVHKHIYNEDNKPFEVKYCPFCSEKLEWE